MLVARILVRNVIDRYWNPNFGFNIGMGMKWLVEGILLREKPVHYTIFRMSSTEDE